MASERCERSRMRACPEGTWAGCALKARRLGRGKSGGEKSADVREKWKTGLKRSVELMREENGRYGCARRVREEQDAHMERTRACCPLKCRPLEWGGKEKKCIRGEVCRRA